MEKKTSEQIKEEFKKHHGKMALLQALQVGHIAGVGFRNLWETAQHKFIVGDAIGNNKDIIEYLKESRMSNKEFHREYYNFPLEVTDNITQPLNNIKEQIEKLGRVYPLHDLKLRVSQLYDSLRDKVITFDIKHVKEYDISHGSFYARYHRIELNPAIVLFINNRFKEMQGCKTYRLSSEGKSNEFTFWYFANQFDKKLKYVDQIQDIVWTLKSRELFLPDNRLIKKDAKRY
jgi:hypothetical protein